VEELHGMLGTLREWDPASNSATTMPTGPAEPGTTVGIRRLPELIEQTNASGLPTRLEVIGQPRPLPSVVDVNVYRITQEALTNARKHAGPRATADVRLRYYPGEVEIEVTNSGIYLPFRGGRPGLGQLGMRERVAASHGSIELGPLQRGGYLVRARMPVQTGADESQESRS
jgi:signal transduction histidine kinase